MNQPKRGHICPGCKQRDPYTTSTLTTHCDNRVCQWLVCRQPKCSTIVDPVTKRISA